MLSLGSSLAVRRFVFVARTPRRLVVLAGMIGAAFVLLTVAAHAQSGTFSKISREAAISRTDSDSTSYSSSTDFAFPESSSADPASAGSPAGGRGGQYDNRANGKRSGRQWAFEAGGGFNAPIGNDIPYITWGGNFTVGGGLHLSPVFSILGEYQFIADKLPGALVAAGGGDTGNAHIQSITVAPVIDLFPKHSTSVYLTGGGGWYHKSTNWNVLVGYDFYGYPVYATANSFSSNQGGLNFGFGFSHRLGGVYGDGTAKLFAEARYLWIDTPPLGEPNGLGRTELIPVTFGVRW
ncbi:MAG TPA: hypothetical protein VGL00_02165 [Terracidiphilus sp.]|jgi:hypothetical protein